LKSSIGVESFKEDVLFMGIFERGDDENKLTTEKMFEIHFSFKKKVNR